ncbi:DUF1127 domain-containing protein [Prosthecomicrobium sp. N25]|uniref:DUF1127 domain-containing protein n=1 Tax=Prosthecomicrobium sp. N25 TaxID=3129254 RepID=UPI00307870A9
MRDAARMIAAQQDGYAPSLAERVADLVRDLAVGIRARIRGRRTWMVLADLDDHLLQDIGLTRADLEAETRRDTLAGTDVRLAELVRRRREERWL